MEAAKAPLPRLHARHLRRHRAKALHQHAVADQADGQALDLELHAENPDYPTIVVQPGEPFEIEGLAVGLIRNSMLR